MKKNNRYGHDNMMLNNFQAVFLSAAAVNCTITMKAAFECFLLISSFLYSYKCDKIKHK